MEPILEHPDKMPMDEYRRDNTFIWVNRNGARGCSAKLAKIFFPPMTLKLSGIVAMVCTKMLIFFLGKKLTGRSLSGAKKTQKAVLPPKSQQCPQCNMPIVSNMIKKVSRVVVCGYLVVSVKFG